MDLTATIILLLTPCLVVLIAGGSLLALDVYAKDFNARGFPPETDPQGKNRV